MRIIIRPASKGFVRTEQDDRGKEFRTAAHGKNTVIVAFVVIIIVIIITFIHSTTRYFSRIKHSDI